jgi:uncharacterized membrane protein
MKKVSIILSACALIIACSKSNNNLTTVDCGGAAKSYANDVSPIIKSYCATNSGCHGTGSSSGPGALTTYEQIFNARSLIRSAVASGQMPKNSSLSATQKNNILCWIDNGAFNN